MPELVRPGDREIAGAPPATLRALGPQQPVLAHQPLHPLAVDPAGQLSPGERGDHSGRVSRIASSHGEHDPIGRR
jgi:hypothetical protein